MEKYLRELENAAFELKVKGKRAIENAKPALQQGFEQAIDNAKEVYGQVRPKVENGLEHAVSNIKEVYHQVSDKNHTSTIDASRRDESMDPDVAAQIEEIRTSEHASNCISDYVAQKYGKKES